jgi:hypothetical protein
MAVNAVLHFCIRRDRILLLLKIELCALNAIPRKDSDPLCCNQLCSFPIFTVLFQGHGLQEMDVWLVM